jgi:zinc-ribbon domain
MMNRMAFCNSCGSTLNADAQFCPKCGAAQTASTISSSVTPTPAAPLQRRNALKPVLIAVAAVVVIGALAIAGLTVIGLQFARHTHVENREGNVRIESPVGTVESTSDPSDIAHQLGIDLYPNAHLLKGNAQNVSIAGMHAVAAEFESDDPADKVADFYKSRLPRTNINVSGGDHYSIVSNDKNKLVTIKIEPHDGKTLIKVANVSGKGFTGSSND